MATLLLLCFFLLSLLNGSSSSNPDSETLLAFKSTSDPSNSLATWNSTSDHCTTWAGVTCTTTTHNRRVSRLVLENLNLRGSFAALSALTQLRVLSLKHNRLSGPIPDLSNLTSLKLLFLSHNELSGEFPSSVTSLFRLYRLDLAYNNLSGSVPETVNRLTHLLTLRLESNRLSGDISALELPSLQELNVSANLLHGQIPKSFSAFPGSAFAESPGLCGYPVVQDCKGGVSDPTRPGSGGEGANGAIASPVVASSPTSLPLTAPKSNNPEKPQHHRHGGGSRIGTAALIAIVVGDVAVLGLVSLLLYCYFWRNLSAKIMRQGKSSSKLVETEKIVYSSSPYSSSAAHHQPTFERGQMVFFEGGVRRFELEDLLRASAEMLGKGGFGTAYKAVLDDGNVVAVKRLKDAQIGGKSQFEQHMAVLGRIHHLNIVSLRAYYFAREEKLLVYDYMPNGSLFWLLHGNRGPGRTPLDWTTRLRIAVGAARGLACIHSSCAPLKLTHGNIKSTNVLLDKTGNARVSDFGLSAFSPSTARRLCGYRAPELLDGKKVTQKSDVYAFGVLLLEILTGKCPSAAVDAGGSGGSGSGYSGLVDLPRWVQSVVREEWTSEVFDLELMRYKDIEEEMVGLLQVAMACTTAVPDQRPKMNQVVKMIDEIRGVAGSPPHEGFDSMTESPALSEDTCAASQ